MKRKKMAVLLACIVTISSAYTMMAYAENFVATEEKMQSELLIENDTKEFDSESNHLLKEEVTDDITESQNKMESEVVIEDDAQVYDIEDDTEVYDLKENSFTDDTYNLKSFVCSAQCSDILLGEKSENSLKVCSYSNGEERILDETNYTVVGYVTETEYLNADHTLDNINNFKTEPDSTGVWLLVFEGITPYYGRQAVRITVHDLYDLSIYDWIVNEDIFVGDNPEEFLKVFLEKSGKQQLLNPENYEVIGYITAEAYMDSGNNLDTLTYLSPLPDCSGEWLIVFEGRNGYYGRQAACITVKDEFDLSGYQCSVKNGKITQGDNLEEVIEVSRYKGDKLNILPMENYRILGYVSEKEFAAGGYDLYNAKNVQVSPDITGGWYLIIEGTNPYYGRIATFFEMCDLGASKVIDVTEKRK